MTLNANGSFSYTPNANFNGTDSFTYVANDGPANSSVATVTITVNAINDAPVAVDDSATTDQDVAVTINVLANDSDVEGDTLDVTGVTQGAGGAIVINGDNTLTYTPNTGYSGGDNFTYTIADGNGGTATASVTITVQGGLPIDIGTVTGVTNTGWTTVGLKNARPVRAAPRRGVPSPRSPSWYVERHRRCAEHCGRPC